MYVIPHPLPRLRNSIQHNVPTSPMQPRQLLIRQRLALAKRIHPRLKQDLIRISVAYPRNNSPPSQYPLDLPMKPLQPLPKLIQPHPVQRIRPLLTQARYIAQLPRIAVIRHPHPLIIQIPQLISIGQPQGNVRPLINPLRRQTILQRPRQHRIDNQHPPAIQAIPRRLKPRCVKPGKIQQDKLPPPPNPLQHTPAYILRHIPPQRPQRARPNLSRRLHNRPDRLRRQKFPNHLKLRRLRHNSPLSSDTASLPQSHQAVLGCYVIELSHIRHTRHTRYAQQPRARASIPAQLRSEQWNSEHSAEPATSAA